MSTYGNKWCSDNVKSAFSSLEDMLTCNIEGEKGAIDGYRHLINVCENENIRALLERIIMDEENHIRVFEALKKKYCGCGR